MTLHRFTLLSALVNDTYVRSVGIVAIVVWVATALWYPLVIAPRLEASMHLQAKLKNARAEYAFREAMARQAVDLNEYFNIVETINDKLNNELRNSDVLTQMADLFDQHHIEVLSESYSKIRKENDYRYFDADFKIKAGYHDIRAALLEFSNLTFMVHMTRFTMTKDEETVVAEIQVRIISFQD